MPASFDWDSTEDIAIALTDKFPNVDPYTVRFTDMHKWITELPGSPAIPLNPMKESWKPFKAHGTKNGPTARNHKLRRIDCFIGK